MAGGMLRVLRPTFSAEPSSSSCQWTTPQSQASLLDVSAQTRAPDSSSASAVSPSAASVSGVACRLMVHRSPPVTIVDCPRNASAMRSRASARRAATGSLAGSTAGASDVSAGTFFREPLTDAARSAFQSEKPQIVGCEPKDSSHSYGKGAQRARCGFSGETRRDGPLRALRRALARLFGTTKPHSKSQRSIPQRLRRARAHRSEVPTQSFSSQAASIARATRSPCSGVRRARNT